VNIQFILNGDDIQMTVDPADRLADLLKRNGLADSVHVNCGLGSCGRCMVICNGRPANACLIPAFQLRNAEIITYEGLAQTPEFLLIEKACRQQGLELCQFCKPAIYLLLAVLLEQHDRPSIEDIWQLLSAVNCRCSAPDDIFSTAVTVYHLKEGRFNGHAGT
jgi:aerobic-type carbon monoxide dehydrogenase small subunit (CoxS/CutS family)